MLESKPTQFKLSAEGQILWQEKLNNPLPGVEVAVLAKGDHPLKPQIVITKTNDVDPEKLRDSLSLWLNSHMQAVLEPLVMLGINPQTEITPDDPATNIIKKVYDNLGIVPREHIEFFIDKLDTEKRGFLRNKKIRLGPVLVFIPALNKPAAVRLRGLLWCLYNDQPLPAQVPADGIVSCKIETENPNEAFYRSIGYPLYGGRAVRIDMLDRVISSIYDNAKDGIFEARHEMAEWLGTPIEDLYKILEAMGHKKIEEPTPIIVEAEIPVLEGQEIKTEEEPAPEKAAPAPQVKPPLAKFRLKRGKASQKSSPRPERKKFEPKAQEDKPERKKFSGEDKKPFSKETSFKDKKKQKFNKNKDNKFDRREARETSIIALKTKNREEDSPFAILQKLVVKSDG